MRKSLALGLLLVFSTPQFAIADDPGATGTPAPASAPTLVSKPTSNAKPTSNSQSTSSAKPAASAKTVTNELVKIRALIELKNYSVARAALRIVDKEFPKNADVNNLLGFTSRKMKLYSAAAGYYEKALSINPNHLGALEYQGELFILIKKVDLAKKNLVKLQELCGSSCEEYLDLKKAIGAR